MKKLRVTHAINRTWTDQVLIRFSGDTEPFWEMRDRLVDLGTTKARWDPLHNWDDGKRGGWWIDRDALSDLQDAFYNLYAMLTKVQQDLPDWDDILFEDEQRDKKKEEEQRAEEQARQRREEEERLTRQREQERAKTTIIMPRTLQEAFSALELPMTATLDDVKKSFRKLALVHHPDKHMQEPETIRVQHEALFKRINRANTIIVTWLDVSGAKK
jgi:hypothetical protein